MTLVADVTLLGLEVLARVAADGSFSAAADRLGYTQSAVSRQMAMLEDAVGERLFLRQRRGVVLTAAGQVLLGHASVALAELDAAREQLSRTSDRVAGRLTVGAFPTAAAALVPAAVAAVLTCHPAVQVVVDEASTPTLLRRVRGGRLDVAVVASSAGQPDHDLEGLHGHRLTPAMLRVAVGAGHRLAGHRRVTPEQLADEGWVVGPSATGEPQFGAWPTLADPRIAFTVRHWPTRLGLVAAGLAISTLPAIATPSVPRGVRVLDVDDPLWSPRSPAAVCLPRPSALAELMLDALRDASRRIAADSADDRERPTTAKLG